METGRREHCKPRGLVRGMAQEHWNQEYAGTLKPELAGALDTECTGTLEKEAARTLQLM